MALAVRGWDPFTGLNRRFDRDFDALVRRSFGGRAAQPFVPAADVVRDGSDVLIRLELPGVDVDQDVDVEVSGGVLTISGRRSETSEQDDSGVLVREIRSGSFQRRFNLPDGVTGERVEADYDRGVLQVRVREAVPQAPSPTKVANRDRSAEESREAEQARETGE
ncbi:Hsp20/alpha crystallin family protein [Saccharopolyspora sp. HNM0986]|uniref:Hsp20/alpha crystallin family protein n=1 Tax=Saccharopolyspora galaxeae TaxID=2781241 RepID=UPI001909B52C|nr:Hsp20/alpha crystallin family protein [Saccharopolyspora sp. HNM0986]MBK0865421.1 Hsp20/alpha crystallin family protein [Saccharopolyspora sp. HNM0986]